MVAGALIYFLIDRREYRDILGVACWSISGTPEYVRVPRVDVAGVDGLISHNR